MVSNFQNSRRVHTLNKYCNCTVTWSLTCRTTWCGSHLLVTMSCCDVTSEAAVHRRKRFRTSLVIWHLTFGFLCHYIYTPRRTPALPRQAVLCFRQPAAASAICFTILCACAFTSFDEWLSKCAMPAEHSCWYRYDILFGRNVSILSKLETGVIY
jgi:hypothetical protein